jgi:hypothetical protein
MKAPSQPAGGSGRRLSRIATSTHGPVPAAAADCGSRSTDRPAKATTGRETRYDRRRQQISIWSRDRRLAIHGRRQRLRNSEHSDCVWL